MIGVNLDPGTMIETVGPGANPDQGMMTETVGPRVDQGIHLGAENIEIVVDLNRFEIEMTNIAAGVNPELDQNLGGLADTNNHSKGYIRMIVMMMNLGAEKQRKGR